MAPGDYLAFSEGAVSQSAPPSGEDSEQTTDWYVREVKAAGERDLARQVLLEEISEEAWSGRDGQVHAQARKFRQIAANKADELANELRAGVSLTIQIVLTHASNSGFFNERDIRVHREKLMASRFVNIRMGHDDQELRREKDSNQVLLARIRDAHLDLEAKESECSAAMSHSRMLQERIWSLEHDMSTLEQMRAALDETRGDLTRSESNMRVLQEQNLHLRVELEGLLKSSQTSRNAHQALSAQFPASPGVGVSALIESGVESSGFVCGEEHDAIVGELMEKVRRLEIALAEGSSSPAVPDARRRNDSLPVSFWAGRSDGDIGQRIDAGRSTGQSNHTRGSGRGSGRGEREMSYGDELVVVLSSSIESSSSSLHMTNASFDEESPTPRPQSQTPLCFDKTVQTNYAERNHQAVQTMHADPRNLAAQTIHVEHRNLAVQTMHAEHRNLAVQTVRTEQRNLDCQTDQYGPMVDVEEALELEVQLVLAKAELDGTEAKLVAAEEELEALRGELEEERARAGAEEVVRKVEEERREEEEAARQQAEAKLAAAEEELEALRGEFEEKMARAEGEEAARKAEEELREEEEAARQREAEAKLAAAEEELEALRGELEEERAFAEREEAARKAEEERREEEEAARQRETEAKAEAAAEAEEEERPKECCLQARMAEAEEWSERLAWEEMERQAADAALYEAIAERDAVMKTKVEEAEARQEEMRQIRGELEKLELDLVEAKQDADGERRGRELLHRELQDKLEDLNTLRRRIQGMEEDEEAERSIISRRLEVLDDGIGDVEHHLGEMDTGLQECIKVRGEVLGLRSKCESLLEEHRRMRAKEQTVQGLTNGLHNLLFAILEAERDLGQARLDEGRLVNELGLKEVQLKNANASLAGALERAEELQSKQSAVREDWEGMVVTTQRLEKDLYHQERLLAVAHNDFQAATEAGQHVAETLAGSQRRLEAVTSELGRRRKREQHVSTILRVLSHWKGFIVWERVRSTLAHLSSLHWLRAFMARVARRWLTWSTRKRRMREFFKARQEKLAHTSFASLQRRAFTGWCAWTCSSLGREFIPGRGRTGSQEQKKLIRLRWQRLCISLLLRWVQEEAAASLRGVGREREQASPRIISSSPSFQKPRQSVLVEARKGSKSEENGAGRIMSGHERRVALSNQLLASDSDSN